MFGSEDVGRIVGDRYRIERELGRGGMGVVYLAHDRDRETDVVVKLRKLGHPDAQRWLKREFRAAATLRHPNLVELYELVANERGCFFTMEYLPGVEPRQWVVRRGMVDFSRVRTVIAQLAEALAFLHARGVIHRDVKPSNVIVLDGTVKLLDFGLALVRDRVDDEVSRESRLVGTAAYLAPEYVDQLQVKPALDIYALGVLAFELVTGHPPYGGALHLLWRSNRALQLRRASSINDQVPADLDELIAHMLVSDPAQRPTALEVMTRISGMRPQVVRRDAPLVGRAAEIAALERSIADDTWRARLVVITGATGAGKTSLVDEALGRSRAMCTPIVWRGRCLERERVPYRAFDFVIDDLAAELAGNDRLASLIEHVDTLGRVFPAFGVATRVSPAAADPSALRERALLAVTRLLDKVLGTQRGVVLIDDLQWADEESLELIELIVELGAKPLTIIATLTVDGELPPRMRALLDRLGPGAETIALTPMTSVEPVVFASPANARPAIRQAI